MRLFHINLIHWPPTVRDIVDRLLWRWIYLWYWRGHSSNPITAFIECLFAWKQKLWTLILLRVSWVNLIHSVQTVWGWVNRTLEEGPCVWVILTHQILHVVHIFNLRSPTYMLWSNGLLELGIILTGVLGEELLPIITQHIWGLACVCSLCFLSHGCCTQFVES